MKISLIICIAVVLAVVLFANFFAISSRLNLVQTEEVYAKVMIDNSASGFDLNTSALSFGKVGAGGNAVRNVSIMNNFNFSIIATYSAEGNISRFIKSGYGEIEKGESKDMAINLYVREGSKEGFYDGKVIFRIYKSKSKSN